MRYERIVQGRVVIETSDAHYRLLHIAHTLARIDVGVTLRPAYDTYREQACGVLISFLADLVESQVDGDELFLRRVIASALFSPYNPRIVGMGREVAGGASAVVAAAIAANGAADP